MSVLYLTRHDCKVKKEGGQIVVRENEKKIAGFPVKDLSAVIITANAQITTQAIFSLLKNETNIIYTDWRGRREGSVSSCRTSMAILQRQLKKFNDISSQILMARYIISRKLENQIKLLRDYAKHRKNKIIKEAADELIIYRPKIVEAKAIDELRGYEGICSKNYFAVFGEILAGEEWQWQGRNRQPAVDPINALLNYGYAFLERDVRLAVLGSGMDERIGFLHSNNGRKDSLIYDLMEMFRQSVIDKLVLRLFNRSSLKNDDFEVIDGACLLSDKARKEWIGVYEDYMTIGGDKALREMIRKAVMAFRCRFLTDNIEKISI